VPPGLFLFRTGAGCKEKGGTSEAAVAGGLTGDVVARRSSSWREPPSGRWEDCMSGVLN